MSIKHTLTRRLTCWPLMVATGMEGVGGMLLSMVTVRLLGTFEGVEWWVWLEAGAGAMRRLGMGGFSCRKTHRYMRPPASHTCFYPKLRT